MNGKIIVAPLNWGLGHASRCVPIINALLKCNYTPIIASDGAALLFLQKEFPQLQSIELPSYHISYGKHIKLKLILQFPKIWKAVNQEKELIRRFLAKNKDVLGLISDNRFGVFNNAIPSIYITHQINIFSGISTFFTSYIHQKIIKKFDECWIPDTSNSEFSGKLSISKNKINAQYIGVLSRFKKESLQQEIDILVILSGPEPNRTLLEKKLTLAFQNDTRNIVFVLGCVEEQQTKKKENNITFYNYVLSNQLEKLLNSSKIVVCRSGYSSVMDLAVLEKKVFFIPTKNQPEQEYLARYLEKKEYAPFSSIDDFTKIKIDQIDKYKGLATGQTQVNKELFSLFKRK
ncbi:glycosyltransferase [Polaribacter sp. WD7]|uniref:glycosyltransferase family protein n=1 Tax=Polaribacter sp. WD7 TaxID=2269061 RepID=UPI000DF4AC53|nr:glycosyltransferase family protein [Polaribacter sp. WD7]RCS26247.1 glycosyltransferase [Polaribacter sp. WD7]